MGGRIRLSSSLCGAVPLSAHNSYRDNGLYITMVYQITYKSTILFDAIKPDTNVPFTSIPDISVQFDIH